MMFRTKKGFFFTLLIVILFFFLLFTIRTWVKGQQDALQSEPARLRISALTSLVKGVELDAGRMASLAGTNAFQASSAFVASNRTRLGNATREVAEILQNNTLNGTGCYGSFCFANQTQNASFNLWNNRTAGKLAIYDVAASFSETNATLYMQAPFSARVSFNLTVSMNDSRGVASYNRVTVISGDAGIAGFLDPLYPLFDASLNRTITACNGSLVSSIAVGSNGSGWVYGNVTNKGGAPACGSISGDKTKILVLGTVPSGCDSSVNSYGGVIFNASSMAIANITIPYTYNYSVNTTTLLTNGTYVLLNNEGSRHEILNVTALRSQLNGTGCYSPTQLGPDFLRRLENSFTASVRGIESFINYSMDAASLANRSWADVYYLNSTACAATGCYRIRGAQNCENSTACADNGASHFRLDNLTMFGNGVSHLQYYGLENLTYPN